VTGRALLVAVLVLAAAAPAALADDFDQVFKDYAKDGRIDPCKHSAAQLQHARKNVPPDIEQYAPDFPDALDQAIEARAKGRCGGTKKAAAPGATAPPASGPVGGTQPPAGKTTTGANGATTTGAAGAPPAPAADHPPAGAPDDNAIARAASTGDSGSGSDVPAPLIGLAVLAGLLALAGLAVGLAGWRGWEPPWALRARHALGEAGWRAGNTWSEFADWVRQAR
jgi:hypothetical protein